MTVKVEQGKRIDSMQVTMQRVSQFEITYQLKESLLYDSEGKTG